jgi:hypothetical protein
MTANVLRPTLPVDPKTAMFVSFRIRHYGTVEDSGIRSNATEQFLGQHLRILSVLRSDLKPQSTVVLLKKIN